VVKIISKNNLSREAAINLLKYINEYIYPNIPDDEKDRILEEIKQKTL